MFALWNVRVDDGNGKEIYGDDYADIWAINRLHFKAATVDSCDHVSLLFNISTPLFSVTGIQLLYWVQCVKNTFYFNPLLIRTYLCIEFYPRGKYWISPPSAGICLLKMLGFMRIQIFFWWATPITFRVTDPRFFRRFFSSLWNPTTVPRRHRIPREPLAHHQHIRAQPPGGEPEVDCPLLGLHDRRVFLGRSEVRPDVASHENSPAPTLLVRHLRPPWQYRKPYCFLVLPFRDRELRMSCCIVRSCTIH